MQRAPWLFEMARPAVDLGASSALERARGEGIRSRDVFGVVACADACESSEHQSPLTALGLPRTGGPARDEHKA